MGRLKDESSSSRSSSRDATLPSPPMFDINSKPNNENEPLLLVFSNDRRRHAYESNELNEILDHEADGLDVLPNESDLEYAYYDEEVVYEYEDDIAAERRKKREAAAAAPDSSIRMRKRTGRASRVAREADESEPWDVDILSPADEIDYPVEIARRLRMARMNETRSAEEEEEDDDDEDDGDTNFRYEGRRNGGRRSDERKRVRRSGKRKLRRNGCHRVPMYVNFEDINWHNWILRPFGYQVGS